MTADEERARDAGSSPVQAFSEEDRTHLAKRIAMKLAVKTGAVFDQETMETVADAALAVLAPKLAELPIAERTRLRETHLNAAQTPEGDMPTYTPDERRVCDYIMSMQQVAGCGSDPIGFLIASHAAIVEAKRQAEARLAEMEKETAALGRSLKDANEVACEAEAKLAEAEARLAALDQVVAALRLIEPVWASVLAKREGRDPADVREPILNAIRAALEAAERAAGGRG